MTRSRNLALVEEFFFVISLTEESEPVSINAAINLAEFNFSDGEIQKLERLCRRAELALLDAFSQQFPAASVVVEIRSLP
ncbi:hypothetical protein H6G89_07595 [Oscillatoria sp. FACHB-1407]|uniref:hypothetical protein n=1 Tax=Oscillatoria sp. FACHB-1407 TaxID=2692847 RepID=UPI0016825659|nr:hypothetical protein [Oscillatoria sp. FACHB-1407]MBD2460906.1 hypothetical protein [Oscillatoria sp. FACHB-1407]